MRNTASGFTAGTPTPHSGESLLFAAARHEDHRVFRESSRGASFGSHPRPFPLWEYSLGLRCKHTCTAFGESLHFAAARHADHRVFRESSRGAFFKKAASRTFPRLQVQPGKILMERLTRPRIRDRIWVNAETGNSTPREGPFRELSVGARKRADAGEYLPEQDAERADFRPSRPFRVRP